MSEQHDTALGVGHYPAVLSGHDGSVR